MSLNDLNRSVGGRIAARRDELGKDQNTLSLDAGVNRRTIQRIEAGTGSAKVETLYLIARALKTTMSELLEGLE